MAVNILREIRPGATISVDGPALITLVHKSGKRSRLHIRASEGVSVMLMEGAPEPDSDEPEPAPAT